MNSCVILFSRARLYLNVYIPIFTCIVRGYRRSDWHIIFIYIDINIYKYLHHNVFIYIFMSIYKFLYTHLYIFIS